MQIYTSKERYSVEYKTRKHYRGEPICLDPTVDLRENETALYFSVVPPIALELFHLSRVGHGAV